MSIHNLQHIMNVDALLEAAKYLEEQDAQKKKLEQAVRNGHCDHQGITNTEVTLPVQFMHQNPQIQSQPPPQIQSIHHNVHPAQTVSTTAVIRTKPEQAISPPATPRFTNSFDIINPLVIDESGEHKRKQPPIPFRTGTREVHNKLEKDRRAHLKECFDGLKKQLPQAPDERKSSNLSILHSAIRYIQTLKKKERELEHEMERLARLKIAHQQRLAVLRKDITFQEGVDSLMNLLPEVSQSTIKEDVFKEEQIPMGKLPLPRITSTQAQVNGLKEGTHVQTTALSVLPVGYPMSQVVLQKVLVPKNISDLSLMSSPTVAHFIAPQPLGGKVVPLVNTQYVVKPVVVVSTPSRPS